MASSTQKPEITSLNDNPFMGLSIEELDARLEMSATAGCWFVYTCDKTCDDKTCALVRLCKFDCDKPLAAADANSVKSSGCCPSECTAHCEAYCPSDCPCAGGGYCAAYSCPGDCPVHCSTYVPPCPAECPALCVAYSCPAECVVYQCTTIYQP